MRSHARVARALLELAAVLGEDAGEGRIVIGHDIHQSDLAAMAGIARENVSRILSDWKRRMIVTRLSQRYCVDLAALERETEPMQSLFETHLNVRDLDRSIEFYREVVGLELAYVLMDRNVAFFWVGGRGCSMIGLWSGAFSPNAISPP